jgi:hypothetical protein
MPTPQERRDEDLRRWRDRFPQSTPIAELRSRHAGSCVGVVRRIRLVPGRTLEVTIEDGSGRLTAVWTGRSRLPGLRLGAGLRVTGTVAQGSDGARVIRNPDWALVAEPYS